MGFKNWETPPEFFAKLDDEFHFTLDAAASHENALCSTYCTELGLFNEHGPINFAFDGLSYDWSNERVFCNPPYDASISKWVDKALGREAQVSVLLLPPSVDTQWFHKIHSELKTGSQPCTLRFGGRTWRGEASNWLTVVFMEGRLKFWKYKKVGPAPRAGNLLVVAHGYAHPTIG